MPDRFAAAMSALTGAAGEEESLCSHFLDVLPVDGASVSTIGEMLGSETVSASDRQAARLDELQFDLGEGPCWDALATGGPVLEPCVRERPQRAWPAFSEAIVNDDIGAIFAFPLMLGPLRLGAVDMYTVRPSRLSDEHAEQTAALATVTSRLLLARALRLTQDEMPAEDRNPFSRRSVDQATGMVLAQLDISADDARLIIQSHAFATHRSMREVAELILDRRLNFATRNDEIEDSHD
ncbi:GAF and ANTAR domain-containing protein [Planctomonas psychrotolerans]|uniref:GAF and ANTAR domain-containing protein n=1 Tax=Planctomonas psychrotolerans TaxID=2528712 RepID=UPI001D0D7D18|nr:GAF and ANTAR domain-containing protein [Planctomonas psychrotolerans]